MRVLVTGGAGFIGSHLLERLLNEGCEVLVLDDLSLGVHANVPEGVTFLPYPCEHVPWIEEVKGVEGIYHLGMPSSSPMYRERACLAGLTLTQFETLLRLAETMGCRLVYASTSSLYNGNPTPWREDMPIHPTDVYTETRYWMERLAAVYHSLRGVESIGLRFFSVYGPRERHKGRYANLVSQFLWALRRGEVPVIYGDGNQTRDFVWVGDVVEACLKAMASKAACDVFNVGTGKAHSFNQVLSMLNEALGASVKPKYIENPIGNYVWHTLADTSKAEKGLGFKAEVGLETGVKKILATEGE